MVIQFDAQMTGDCPEIMRGQIRPDHTGCRERAEIAAGIGYAVVAEQIAEHPHVENGVMGGKQRVLEMRTEFLKHGVEARRVSDSLVRDAVNADKILPEPADALRRLDQPLDTGRDLAGLYNRDTDGTRAGGIVVGGLEINDGDFHACADYRTRRANANKGGLE